MFNSIIKTEHSQLTLLPKDNCRDIRWGSFSQVEAEIEILQLAKTHGNYDYYHLISGQDLPIKNQNYIHRFFENIPSGTNLIGFKDYSKDEKKNVMKRVVPIHLFKNNLRHRNKLIRLIYRSIEETLSQIQRLLGLKISYNVEYRKGCNWVSITSEFCDYILSKKEYIESIFKKSILCDEMFIQTLVWNSPFRYTVFNYEDEYLGCMREIDWERGNPYTWKIEDFEQLKSSEKLFARKFSSQIDKGIIDKITHHVLSNCV